MKTIELVRPKGRKFGAICRNGTTRIIHLFGGGQSYCGSSKRNTVVGLKEAEAAPSELFCKKCFRNKPEAFETFKE